MSKKRIKVSELTPAASLAGFYTLGYKLVDGESTSVKFDLSYVQTAYQNTVEATFKANKAADAANKAASDANTKMSQITQEATQTMTDLRQLEATVSDQEAIRETFYTQVQAKEQARQNDEAKRQEAAKEHAEAEALRKQEEEKRNATFDAKVQEATDAVSKATAAGKEAISATGNAKDATGKAQTAADRLNALSDHRDKIVDGYWWRWNEETSEWYNTGEIAKGNVMFATFEVDPITGRLTMFTDPEYTGANFELDQNGKLQVII